MNLFHCFSMVSTLLTMISATAMSQTATTSRNADTVAITPSRADSSDSATKVGPASAGLRLSGPRSPWGTAARLAYNISDADMTDNLEASAETRLEVLG